MASLARQLALGLALGAGLGGCASTWESESVPSPQTYTPPPDQLERGVGRLRRLWLIPAVVHSTDCPDTPSDPELARQLDAAVKRYLEGWKGYEVVNPAPATADMGLIADQLGAWQAGETGDGTAPASTQLDGARQTARGAGVDAFVVLHARLRCLNTADIALYFMIIGMPNWRSKLFEKNLSAGIYEAHSGRLVWKRQVNVLHPNVGGGTTPGGWAGLLFDNLENALPAVLLP